MSRHFLLMAGGLVVFGSAIGPASDSFAQVWVGGGVHVRAPFVRVDVGPYGGVSVRAPFTAIDIPPDYYYEPYPVVIEERVVEPAFPTASEMAAMDDGQLQNALVAIDERLERRLDRFNTGETWQRYLQLPPAAVDATVDPAIRREALVKLLEKFHRVTADPQYPMIASLPAFVAMQDVLTEIISRPEGGGPRPNVSPKGRTVEPEELPLPAPEQPQPLPPQGSRPFLRPR
jgi:hypothetical protein